jgi:diaminohydroxyphosphoribosylaminopyrimidine deaminase / 5-amino-6-(5-phosphoribosylamino)uracil reductase
METYMRYVLGLAARGSGFVAPNPMVGAMILAEGRIIGAGYHQQFGGHHAEVYALNNVYEKDKHLLPESTLFVSLEPCNHFGKTPPCTEKIISSGIKKVVIGTLDPNPLVAGKGVQRLRDAGIEVITGVLEAECRQLNRFFFTFHEKKRPYITLKWAESADGYISATAGKPVHLTNSESDIIVHKKRAEHQAILVGANTIITDNPKLTTRLWEGKNPIRIVIDTHGNLPFGAVIFDTSAPTIIFHFGPDNTQNNIEYIHIENTQLTDQILHQLYIRNINSVLVEGGTKTHQLFLDSNQYDSINIFKTPHLLISGIQAPVVDLSGFIKTPILNDILYTKDFR